MHVAGKLWMDEAPPKKRRPMMRAKNKINAAYGQTKPQISSFAAGHEKSALVASGTSKAKELRVERR